jgi:hypothetical protein
VLLTHGGFSERRITPYDDRRPPQLAASSRMVLTEAERAGAADFLEICDPVTYSAQPAN